MQQVINQLTHSLDACANPSQAIKALRPQIGSVVLDEDGTETIDSPEWRTQIMCDGVVKAFQGSICFPQPGFDFVPVQGNFNCAIQFGSFERLNNIAEGARIPGTSECWLVGVGGEINNWEIDFFPDRLGRLDAVDLAGKSNIH